MDLRDPDVEHMIKDILEDEFDRKDIEVKAFGPRNHTERCVFLLHGKVRVPIIPMRYEYREINSKKPPRLLTSLEDWRTSRTGDLPHMISRAITEMRRLEERKVHA